MSEFRYGTKFYRYIDGFRLPEVLRYKEDDKGKMKMRRDPIEYTVTPQEFSDMLTKEFYCSTPSKKLHKDCMYRTQRKPYIAFKLKEDFSWDHDVTLIQDQCYTHLTEEEVKEKFTVLNPDAIIVADIVQVNDTNDVMVYMVKDGDVWSVCRQNAIDFFDLFDPMHTIGISVSRKTAPSESVFQQMFVRDEVMFTKQAAVYLDDKLGDIMRYIGNTKKYDNVLRVIKQDAVNTNVKGACGTFIELLRQNHFMYDFYEAFDMLEVPIAIEPGQEVLTNQQLSAINAKYDLHATEAHVLPYDKTINLNEIKKKYKLIVTPDTEKVYIMAYTV